MQNHQKLNRAIAILLAMLSLGCSTSALAAPIALDQMGLVVKVKGNFQTSLKGSKPSEGFNAKTIYSFNVLEVHENNLIAAICESLNKQKLPFKKIIIDRMCKGKKSPAGTIKRDPSTPPLTEKEVSQIEAYVKILQQKLIDNDTKGIAIAYLYKSYGLDQKAIDKLDELVNQGSKTTAVYQLLGDIYHLGEINKPLAIYSYQTGLDLAAKEGNVKAQTYIQARLNELTKGTN